MRRLAAFLLLLAFALPCASPTPAQFRNLQDTACYNRKQQKKQQKAERKLAKIQRRNIKNSAKGQRKADRLAAKKAAKDFRHLSSNTGDR